MKFELATHLSPEEVIEKAEEYYRENTGLEIQQVAMQGAIN